jgi:hypothetical protein
MNSKRILAGTAALAGLMVGGAVMSASTASAATVKPDAQWNSISGTSGAWDQDDCGVVTRHKTDYGSIKISLSNAPVAGVDIRLRNANGGAFFAGPVRVRAGDSNVTIATDVWSGTAFHVCASSPLLGGDYNGSIYY